MNIINHLSNRFWHSLEKNCIWKNISLYKYLAATFSEYFVSYQAKQVSTHVKDLVFVARSEEVYLYCICLCFLCFLFKCSAQLSFTSGLGNAQIALNKDAEVTPPLGYGKKTWFIRTWTWTNIQWWAAVPNNFIKSTVYWLFPGGALMIFIT